MPQTPFKAQDSRSYICGTVSPGNHRMAELRTAGGGITVADRATVVEGTQLRGGSTYRVATTVERSTRFDTMVWDGDEPVHELLRASRDWKLLTEFPSGPLDGAGFERWGNHVLIQEGLWQPLDVRVPTDNLLDLSGLVEDREEGWRGMFIREFDGTPAEWQASSVVDVDEVSGVNLDDRIDHSKRAYLGILIHSLKVEDAGVTPTSAAVRIGWRMSYEIVGDTSQHHDTAHRYSNIGNFTQSDDAYEHVGLWIDRIPLLAAHRDGAEVVMHYSGLGPGTYTNTYWERLHASFYLLQQERTTEET